MEISEIAQNEQFHLFPQCFCAICILKSCNSHISVVVYSVFEFWMNSKWCIGEWLIKSVAERTVTCDSLLSIIDDEGTLGSLVCGKLASFSAGTVFIEFPYLFSEKHAAPAKAIRNEGQRMIPAKFEGEPTYKSKYCY